MNKVRIIVDSAADMEADFVSVKGNYIVPLKIIFGEEEFLDGVNLDGRRFYEKLIESDELPTTSQATVIDFEQVYKEVSDAGDTAVVITISSKLSGTFQSACIAAEDYKDKIRVVDSLQATVGEHILADLAVMLSEKGWNVNEIADKLEQKREDICLIALLDTLEYLKKGGRISKSVAFVGGILSIKPVICIKNGEVVILGKAKGSKNGNNMLNEFITKEGGVDFDMPYRLGYTGISDALLKKYIYDNTYLWESESENLPITIVGSAIGTHAGPGAIAVAFFRK